MNPTPRTEPRPARTARLLLASAAALALVACSWSVPADPGRNAALRGRAADATGAPSPNAPYVVSSGGDAGRALYYAKCSACHEAFAPSHASPAMWSLYVRRYGPRAGLFGTERDQVLRWLQANAR